MGLDDVISIKIGLFSIRFDPNLVLGVLGEVV
jgi:hypothetical protein